MILYSNGPINPADIVNQLFPNLWIFLVHFIAAIVLMLLLARWVYNPFRKAMRKRHDFIQQTIDRAIDQESQAQINFKTAKANLVNTKTVVKNLIFNAELEAKHKKLIILNNARSEFNEIEKQHKLKLKKSREDLAQKIKQEVIDNSFLLTQKILVEKITKTEHNKIIKKFIDKL